VFLDGEVVGFNMVSRDTAYKELHSKLVKNYAMEAILLRACAKGKARGEKSQGLYKGHHSV